jgi:Putative Ig domain
MHARIRELRSGIPVVALLLGLSVFLDGCASGTGSGGGQNPPPQISIMTTSLPNATMGTSYSATLTATGGTPPYTWSLMSGTLPAGLSLNASTGAIAGKPTAAVSGSALTFKVKDSSNPALSQTVNLTLTVAPAALVISTVSLPNGQVGVAYSTTLAATGGTTPYTWSTTSGTLPAGLLLNASTGAIAGTPTVAVSGSALTFKVTDSSNPALSQTKNLTLTIASSSGSVSVVVSPKRGEITTSQTQTFNAVVTNDVLNQGVTWSVDTIIGGNSTVGTISAGGVYNPPTTGGLHTITATSVTDVTKSDFSSFGVTDLAGVFTYLNDVTRTGQNQKEYGLNTATVNATTFGKLFSCTVDAAVYAQPLWVANLNFSGTIHNVVYVATQHDSLYAFDADNPGCVNLWGAPVHLMPAGETFVTSGDVSCSDLQPNIGIVGTPVIDRAAGTLFVVTKTKTTTGTATFHQRIHTIDLLTGAEKLTAMEVQAAVAGTGTGSSGGVLNFDPKINNQRPALLLVGGHLIISWASHCDFGPYHGWVMSYNAATLAQEAVFNTSPNGSLSGVWMSGNGPAADAGGNIYFATGNGSWDGITAYGDSIVKLAPPSAGSFTVLDYFTPHDQASLSSGDVDLGSGGLLLLPDVTSGAHTQLLVQAGKDGRIFLVDRNNMTHLHTPTDQIVQELPNSTLPGGMWGSPTYWNGSVYFGAAQDPNTTSDPMRAFAFNAVSNPGMLSAAPTSQTAKIFGFSGPTPPISSIGNTNGIVWAIDNSQWNGSGAAVLYGYDATNLGTLLYNSTQATANRDQGGGAVKFTVPTVANGKVYVGGKTTLTVYGLLPN